MCGVELLLALMPAMRISNADSLEMSTDTGYNIRYIRKSGNASRRIVKLGLMRKVILGRNSPVKRIMSVEITVFSTRTAASDDVSRTSHGFMMAEMAIP